MTDGANTIDTASSQHVIRILITTGIGIYINTIFGFITFTNRRSRQHTLMRPNGIFGTSISLAETCVNNKYLVHFAVTIPVVVFIVYVFISHLASLQYHVSCLCIHITILGMCAIVSHVLRQSIGTYHVEIQFKLSVTLCQEIIFHTAFESQTIGKAFFVGNIIEHSAGVSPAELYILEIDKDDESFLCSRKMRESTCYFSFRSSFGKAFDTFIIGFLTFCQTSVHNLCFICNLKCAGINILYITFTIICLPIRGELITFKLCYYRSSVCKFYSPLHSFLSWNSMSTR